MALTLYCVCLLVLFSAVLSQQNCVWEVNGETGEDVECRPCKTIEPAIILAQRFNAECTVNRTIAIAAGVYRGEGNTDLLITGGTVPLIFQGTNAILDGDGKTRLVTVYNTGAATYFFGLTFRNGNGNSQRYSSTINGGAVYVTADLVWFGGSQFLNNTSVGSGGAIAFVGRNWGDVNYCLFNGNRAHVAGGAVYVAIESAGEVLHSSFTQNSASSGGALSLSGNYRVFNNTITQNSAQYGGGIHLYRSLGTCYETQILNNSASFVGGGIYDRYSQVTYFRSEFNFNSASVDGGGGAFIGSRSTIYQSVIEDNRAGQNGGGLLIVELDAIYGLVVKETVVGLNSARVGGGYHCSNSTLDFDCSNTLLYNSATDSSDRFCTSTCFTSTGLSGCYTCRGPTSGTTGGNPKSDVGTIAGILVPTAVFTLIVILFFVFGRRLQKREYQSINTQ